MTTTSSIDETIKELFTLRDLVARMALAADVNLGQEHLAFRKSTKLMSLIAKLCQQLTKQDNAVSIYYGLPPKYWAKMGIYSPYYEAVPDKVAMPTSKDILHISRYFTRIYNRLLENHHNFCSQHGQLLSEIKRTFSMLLTAYGDNK